MKKNELIAIILPFVCTSMFAQEINPILDPNRVGKIEVSRTIKKKNILIEGGFSYYKKRITWEDMSGYQFSQFQMPKLKLTYGVSNNTEVQFSYVSYSGHAYRMNSIDTDYQTSVFKVGLKFNLTDQKGWLPETSILVDAQYSKVLGETDFGGIGTTLSWRYKFSNKISLSGDFKYIYFDQKYFDYSHLGPLANIRFSYNFSHKIGVYAESKLLYDGQMMPNFGVGVWYKPAERIMLNMDLGVGGYSQGVGSVNQANLHFSLGGAFLLSKPYKNTK